VVDAAAGADHRSRAGAQGIVIPFLDLGAQHQKLRSELQDAMLQVLDSRQFVLGEAVESFEARFADYCDTRHAVAVSSGTAALHLALLAAGVGAGDEVITTPMTFVATAAAILYVGARPVFVDIDPDRWTIDVDRIPAALTARTKAIVPVHLHGLMADIAPLLEIAREHGLAVIEDAAQAHGAEYLGRRAGSLGHAGCFSFYPGKNLGACGEGGAIVTNDSELARTMRALRDWGQTAKYHHQLKGFNYRMDGLQGAVLGVKLAYIEAWTEARRRNAGVYDRLLQPLGVQRPADVDGQRHVYHVYAVLLREREAVRARLHQAGIATGVHYPTPVHLQPAYADLSYRAGDFPVAERVAAQTLSLPMYPELTTAQIEQVVECLRQAIDAEGRVGAAA
jgi:dTDP-4-amino-4,6-dideoxygalactose transaminase